MGKVFNALKKVTVSEGKETKDSKLLQDRNEDPGISDTRIREKLQGPVQGEWDERIALATSLTGPIAEIFRTLRTRILRPQSGTVPRSILITSATPGEGKSFVCANLGVSLAQSMQQYSMLVDCDLRIPSLHSFFGLPNEWGLVDYLADKAHLSDLILQTGVSNLSMIPSGPVPVNPAELIGSETMEALVSELAGRYADRIILLDSPPVQAASETAVLAQHVDGVILVVRSGMCKREDVKELVELVGPDKILGVVFNAYTMNVFDSKVFGYQKYKYAYKYGK